MLLIYWFVSDSDLSHLSTSEVTSEVESTSEVTSEVGGGSP
jgi:hypothetical protein